MLEKQIKEIQDYFKGIEITNDTIIIKVLFKDKWIVMPRKDDLIKVAHSNDNKNEWYLYANYNEVTIDEMFTYIKAIIDVNISASLKMELFNQKVTELKELFANNELNILQTLTFKMKKPKTVKSTQNVTIIEKEPENNIEENS